jgi:hypothetical protein
MPPSVSFLSFWYRFALIGPHVECGVIRCRRQVLQPKPTSGLHVEVQHARIRGGAGCGRFAGVFGHG